jgi:hypothetical protein
MIPAIDREGAEAGAECCEPRSRCVCGKARYATEKEAGRAAKRMRYRGRDRSYEGLLRPYQCPERKWIWHVGHDRFDE